VRVVADGELDALLFTNATQIEHAMMVARRLGIAQEFKKAADRIAVASVGPTCTEALNRYGLSVDIEPERPMMGALVARAAQKARAVIEQKKKSPLISMGAVHNGAKKGDALHDSLFLKACRREKTERTPLWLMRQAGRYMKEYRELRAKVSFLELCKNSDLASEVTVDAAHRLNVDAAIIFSDILIIVEPLGFLLSYEKNEGPEIANPFRSAVDLKRMQVVEPEESLRFVFDAIRKTRRALKPNIPLIGFCGAPFTVASYAIEGKGSKSFSLTKALMYSDPASWHAFLEKITDASIAYVNGQVAAGAQVIQIFDSWVGCLSPEDFRNFVLPHTRRLIKSITPGVPVISFGTQTSGFLSLLRQAGGDVIGVDWRIELDEAWDILGDVAIQGNLDPQILLADKKTITSQAQRILAQAGGRPGHIFNLGHGVLPATPLENVMHLIDVVKNYRAH
jgi:uroporphyrinogen decarboxylase